MVPCTARRHGRPVGLTRFSSPKNMESSIYTNSSNNNICDNR